MSRWKFGVRYVHGKLLVFKDNPGAESPAWAVDIREIIAMVVVGVSALILIFQEEYDYAMTLLVGLLAYATGRTVPGGVRRISESSEAPEG